MFSFYFTLLQGKYEEALQKYDEILQKNPSSPRAHLGKADTLDKIAEQKRSNEFLEQSIAIYDLLLSLSDVPDELMKIGGRRLANRQQFRGKTFFFQLGEEDKFYAYRQKCIDNQMDFESLIGFFGNICAYRQKMKNMFVIRLNGFVFVMIFSSLSTLTLSLMTILICG